MVILTRPKTSENEPDYSDLAYDEPDDESYDNNAALDTGPDNNTPPEDVTPIYAYLDVVYKYMGTNTDYLTEPYAITGNGTYTVTINRSDNSETEQAFDGLSYMGIRLLDDETADVDIKNVTITDVTVNCDGVQLKVDDTGSTPYEDGVIYDFFDSYDPSGNNESVYDFSDKNTIEISFTITGAKIK